MLKGTNRRIIEINKTDNDYFEKAILFVKTDKVSFPAKTLKNEADDFLKNMYDKKAKKLNKFAIVFSVLFLLMIGVLVFSLMFL